MQGNKTKAIVVSLLVAGGVAMTSSPASAWTCWARGTTGASGWGSSVSLDRAKRIAMANCVVRTRRGAVCYLTGCR